MKTNIKIKTVVIIISIFALIHLGACLAIAYPEYQEPATITIKHEKELPIGEWIMNEFESQGLNKYVAYCVIMGESKFNPNAISSTNDFGIMQWNIQHIKSGFISLECAGNYKCSIKKAIEKVKKDKGWSAWFGYKNNNCGVFGKTFN